MSLIEFTIDGKKVSANPEQTILEVARENKIDIPTLCEHEALQSFGSCRLCVVEITMDNWKDYSKIVASCLYPVKKGLVVSTKSKRVIENRKTIISLLLARTPKSAAIKKLATEYEVKNLSLATGKKDERCILCALCTRLCAHQGTFAISTVGRGTEKEIGTYWKSRPEECIGCLVCANCCPTDAIPFEELDGKRKIWDKTFELAECSKCGKKTHLTPEQVSHYAKKSGLSEEIFQKCEDCSRGETAMTFLKLIQDTSADIMNEWGLKPEHHKMPHYFKEST